MRTVYSLPTADDFNPFIFSIEAFCLFFEFCFCCCCFTSESLDFFLPHIWFRNPLASSLKLSLFPVLCRTKDVIVIEEAFLVCFHGS